MVERLTFDALVRSIRQIHDRMAAQAGRAVNIGLTLRNWAIGYHIREYEQNGCDRAEYGKELMERLSEGLGRSGAAEYHPRELRRCRAFYCAYPGIRGALSPEFWKMLPEGAGKPPASKKSGGTKTTKRGTLSPELAVPPERLVRCLAFSHFAELIEIDDPLKRTFYEFECIRGNWSVRELKRQINSLYYERSGLSRNKQKLAQIVQSSAETASPNLAIRDPYVFEFLGLRSEEVMGESTLEDRLLDRMQEFLLELGNGFCFEARQKRILIGDSHNFVDLVFYHRILRCHVLVELKVSEFTHEHIGQLNTYVSWYRENMMAPGELTFLAHALIVPTTDPEDLKRYDKEVEEIAMRVAWSHEEGRGATVQDVHAPDLAHTAGLPEYPGFDLFSGKGQEERAIEVKGRAAAGEVELSENEWAKACNLRELYWLYVVYSCGSPNPVIHRIQNPFGRLVASPGGGVIIGEKAILDAAGEGA